MYVCLKILASQRPNPLVHRCRRESIFLLHLLSKDGVLVLCYVLQASLGLPILLQLENPVHASFRGGEAAIQNARSPELTEFQNFM